MRTANANRSALKMAEPGGISLFPVSVCLPVYTEWVLVSPAVYVLPITVALLSVSHYLSSTCFIWISTFKYRKQTQLLWNWTLYHALFVAVSSMFYKPAIDFWDELISNAIKWTAAEQELFIHGWMIFPLCHFNVCFTCLTYVNSSGL